MKAVTYRSVGAAKDVLRVEEIAAPQASAGEVVVDLTYSGVNPSDVKARAGSRAMVNPVIVPHSDGAGIISAVGEGVNPDRIGERVWIWNGQWQRAFGTAAEQIALPSEQAVSLPDQVDLETGAVLGIPGLTAAHVVFSGGDIAGKTLLVHGGAGTVGYLAVQLAKWGGARVIATCSTSAKERVRQAGADVTLNYADPDLADQVLAANDGQPIDRIVEVEFGTNVELNAAVIAENGRINAYGSAKNMQPALPFYDLMFKAVTLEMALIYLLPLPQRQQAITKLHKALTDGALTCPIQAIVPMQDCAHAHELVEAGGRSGAVLLQTR